jgi:hypothetical protein
MPPSLSAETWFLTGPTASGKTAVGLELAALLDAEIVSLDSMALYRGMDIGTAKPTLAERARVPHHLIDVIDPDAGFSLGRRPIGGIGVKCRPWPPPRGQNACTRYWRPSTRAPHGDYTHATPAGSFARWKCGE